MIHPFAVDPGLLAYWSARAPFRFWKTQFELGERRVIAGHPSSKRWKQQMRDTLREIGPNLDETTATRAAELFKLFSQDCPVLDRSDAFDGNKTWIENAIAAHLAHPFRAILAVQAGSDEAAVIAAVEHPPESPLWSLPPDGPMARTTAAMLGRLDTMLRYATRITLVDPYFDFHKRRFAEPVLEMLAAISSRSGKPPIRVELIVSEKPTAADGSQLDAAAHRANCFARSEGGARPFSACVPSGLPMVVSVVRERARGDLLHDRFVLTDVGGIQFTVGLDATTHPWRRDGCHLLDGARLADYRSAYVEPREFDVVDSWRLGAVA